MKKISQIGLGILFSGLIIGLIGGLYGMMFYAIEIILFGAFLNQVDFSLFNKITFLIPLGIYILLTWMAAFFIRYEWPIAAKTVFWINSVAFLLVAPYLFLELFTRL